MRVTERSRWLTTQRHLEQTSSRGDAAGNQAMSGKRVTRASDDVSAFEASERLTAHARRHSSYQESAGRAQSELERVDSVLIQGHDLLSRARELAVQFGDASYGSDEMSEATHEVAALRQALTSLANSEQGGRYLFGGVETGKKPVDVATGAYQGSDVARKVTVGEGMEVSFQTASEVFGAAGSSAFDALQAFEAALASGDAAGVKASLSGIDGALERMQDSQQRVGSSLQKARTAGELAESMKFIDEDQATALTEADFVEAISTMKQSSTIYELSVKIASEQKQLSRSILNL